MKGVLIILGTLIGALLIAYGAWSEPPTGPTTGDLQAALNVSSLTQEKLGGLGLNGLEVPWGLIVSGNLNTGLVGIGLENPSEKLDINGNFNISGLIKPDDKKGKKDYLLTRAPGFKMDWTKDLAWMDIQRMDIPSGSSCIEVFPACLEGWTHYEDIVFSDDCTNTDSSTPGYGGAIRICYQNRIDLED